MNTQPKSPHLTLALIVVFYGAMVGLALALAWGFDLPSLWHLPPLAPPAARALPDGPLSWGIGIALGLLAHGLGVIAQQRFAWARAFYARMAQTLGPMSRPGVLVAAACSGLAEELLFRGALLPLLGLWLQAFIFGLLHAGPDRAMRYWPFYAAVMGVLFGLLYQHSGSLLPPVLAHFTVNTFGLSALITPSPEAPGDGEDDGNADAPGS